MSVVGVMMGSKTDEPLMQPALDTLAQLGIEYEVSIISAHRTPEKVREYGLSAEQRGIEIIIAGAGGAAHLAGVVAAWTLLPVIGVPLATSKLGGVDALYAMVQMPGGVPVACVAVDGAKNAALLAASILALKDDKIKSAYKEYRRKLSEGSK
ncbi:MAG: 5-(carboxyamino)imidazole ribonucleotide mutase [Chloroflexota bacterium]|nr:5-(carboxyamino)imidazole ribonucleotide mutase [Chloroflexota bacterium]